MQSTPRRPPSCLPTSVHIAYPPSATSHLRGPSGPRTACRTPRIAREQFHFSAPPNRLFDGHLRNFLRVRSMTTDRNNLGRSDDADTRRSFPTIEQFRADSRCHFPDFFPFIGMGHDSEGTWAGNERAGARRKALVRGQMVHRPDRDAFVRGQMVHRPVRDAFVRGQMVLRPDPDAFVRGQTVHRPDRDAFVRGQMVHRPDRDAFVRGQMVHRPDRDTFVRGQMVHRPGRNAFVRRVTGISRLSGDFAQISAAVSDFFRS